MVRGQQTEPSVSDAIETVRAVARASRVSEFDAYVVSKRTRRILMERGVVSGADAARATMVHVRVCADGRVGGAFCNSFGPSEISKCVTQAVKMAGLMEPDSKWRGFPSCGGKYPLIDRIHDKSVASLSAAVMSEMAEEMVDSALSVSKEVSVTYGAVESAERTLGVANSSGVDTVFSETELQATVSCVAGTGLSVSPDCEEHGLSRDCSLRMDKIGERAGWVADKSYRLTEANTEEAEVVFSPFAVGDTESGLLSIILSKALSGQNVLQRISFLADRVGDHIWSEKVTLVDNPLLSGKCGSRPFDDEGVPAQRTKLVVKGVLDGFVWDNRSGSISGTGSTGNAVRDLASGNITAAPLSLQLSPGRGSLKSLVESVDHGYLVWGCQGAHTSDTETGGFSFVASPAMLIEDGEVVGGVRGAMITGNLDELMRNVERVGADVVDFRGALMPSVLFRDVKVTTG